ncbi:MAG: hypothetical protein LBI02_06170 [Opitutaceae bacterium]|nr:hypothetical protein [Opitutaceae bacterium]
MLERGRCWSAVVKPGVASDAPAKEWFSSGMGIMILWFSWFPWFPSVQNNGLFFIEQKETKGTKNTSLCFFRFPFIPISNGNDTFAGASLATPGLIAARQQRPRASNGLRKRSPYMALLLKCTFHREIVLFFFYSKQGFVFSGADF